MSNRNRNPQDKSYDPQHKSYNPQDDEFYDRQNDDRYHEQNQSRSQSRSSGQRNAPSDQGPHSGKGPKGHERSSEKLKEQVCDALEDNGHVDATEIEVEVNDCEVTLSGKVSSRDEKRKAEHCAESVRGIKDVHNRLTVDSDRGKGSQGDQQKDSDTSAQARGGATKAHA